MDGFGDFDELVEHKGLCVLWVRKQKLWWSNPASGVAGIGFADK